MYLCRISLIMYVSVSLFKQLRLTARDDRGSESSRYMRVIVIQVVIPVSLIMHVSVSFKQLRLTARDDRGSESSRYMRVIVIQVVIPVFPQYDQLPRVTNYVLSAIIVSK